MTYHARMYAGVCPECLYTYVSDKKKDWAPHCTECGTLRFRRSAKSLDQLVTQVWESVRQVGDEEVMRRRVDEAVRKYNEMVGTGLLARNRYTGSLGDTEEIRMGWRSRALRGRRKKKFQWRSYVPYRMELIGRLEGPIVGSVCGSCGWVLIMAGRPRRRACPVCDVEHMRTHGGDGFDEMSRFTSRGELPTLWSASTSARTTGFLLRRLRWRRGHLLTLPVVAELPIYTRGFAGAVKGNGRAAAGTSRKLPAQ
jgi:hypothetical protein